MNKPVKLTVYEFQVTKGLADEGKVFIGVKGKYVCHEVLSEFPKLYPMSFVKILREINLEEVSK